MSDEKVISVNQVSKAYRIWETPTARLLSPLLYSTACLLPEKSSISGQLRNRAAEYYDDFFALHDISFSVSRGQAIGIIGRNGSGKSTLLQIIAGTLQPTTGSVKICGRVAALLELGSGFNPEFTGRENVFLNAAVLGLSREQIESKFEEIEKFAGIGSFIEQPVRTYSSGMQLRLAFAVQTAVEPEILIVDEALSVGDEAFSRKCISRVNQLRDRGTSLLLVSHSANLITSLCEQALLLEGGRLLLNAPPKQVISRYHRLIFTGQDVAENHANSEGNVPEPEDGTPQTNEPDKEPVTCDESCFDPSMAASGQVAYEPCGVRIRTPQIINSKGIRVNCLTHSCEYTYTYETDILEDCFGVVFMCGFRSKEGFELGGICSHINNTAADFLAAGTSVKVIFRFRCTMLPDTFFINAGIMGILNGERTYLHRLVDVVQFRVLPATNLFAAGMIAFGNECVLYYETMPINK